MTRNHDDPKLSRRAFAKAGLGAAAAVMGAGLMPRISRADDHEAAKESNAPVLVTDVAENAGLLGAIKYVAVSETEGKNCGNCQLLIERDGEVGRCGLFQKGKVSVAAHCTSWIQKAGA